MNPAIRAADRMRPLIIVGAIGMHAIAAASIPAYVQVSQLFEETAFVDLEAVAPEPEVVAAPLPEPERVARPTPRDEPCEEQPVAAAEPPAATATPAPPAETPAVEAAPSDPITANGGSVTIATTGNVGAASGNGTSTSELAASSSTTTSGPVIDRRALYREYRASVSSAIGRLPPLRGTREQLDVVVLVGMHIGPDGRVSDVRVVRSSGHPVVDQHVVEYIRSLRRLPTPPAELGIDGREFTYSARVGT